jgi:hypothetical protein
MGSNIDAHMQPAAFLVTFIGDGIPDDLDAGCISERPGMDRDRSKGSIIPRSDLVGIIRDDCIPPAK